MPHSGSLRHQLLLRTIRPLCWGMSIKSQEGTTQGDPLATPLYALATIPFIQKLSSPSSVRQVWYADDSAAVGKLSNILHWWRALSSHGPAFGYFVNNTKTWLVVKEEVESEAQSLFRDTNIHITSEGRPYLGSPLGSQAYVESFVHAKVDSWRSVILSLAEVALSSPHAALAALTHGITSLWIFCAGRPPTSVTYWHLLRT